MTTVETILIADAREMGRAAGAPETPEAALMGPDRSRWAGRFNPCLRSRQTSTRAPASGMDLHPTRHLVEVAAEQLHASRRLPPIEVLVHGVVAVLGQREPQ